MFALLDLAFLDSRACPSGGYSSVRGRYSKRHMLLVQTLVELDAGDPIFYCSDPFEMIHKLKMRPAFQLSKKHTSTIAKDILKKVWVRSGMSMMGAGLRNVHRRRRKSRIAPYRSLCP